MEKCVGKALVYTQDLSKHFFMDCSTYHKASGVTVARLAQHAGASLVVIGAISKVGGRGQREERRGERGEDRKKRGKATVAPCTTTRCCFFGSYW
jgi:hypothetical protein